MDRGDGQPGGAPLLLDELAELLPAHQIDELGLLAQFEPPSGAAASEAAPLELIRSDCATGYLGVTYDARCTNGPYGARLYLGRFKSAEDAATAYALAVRRASEPHGCAVTLERKHAAAQRKLELMERKFEIAQRYVPKRDRAAFLAEIAAADAADADADADAADADADAADAAEIAAEPKPAKRRKREGAPLTTAQKSQRQAAAAKETVRGIIGADGKESKAPRVLTLSELKLDPLPEALTSQVLKAYVFAAGFTLFGVVGGQGKSNLARRLVGFLESKGVTEAQWSAAAGKLELR